jgi:hypothetical protein
MTESAVLDSSVVQSQSNPVVAPRVVDDGGYLAYNTIPHQRPVDADRSTLTRLPMPSGEEIKNGLKLIVTVGLPLLQRGASALLIELNDPNSDIRQKAGQLVVDAWNAIQENPNLFDLVQKQLKPETLWAIANMLTSDHQQFAKSGARIVSLLMNHPWDEVFQSRELVFALTGFVVAGVAIGAGPLGGKIVSMVSSKFLKELAEKVVEQGAQALATEVLQDVGVVRIKTELAKFSGEFGADLFNKKTFTNLIETATTNLSPANLDNIQQFVAKNSTEAINKWLETAGPKLQEATAKAVERSLLEIKDGKNLEMVQRITNEMGKDDAALFVRKIQLGALTKNEEAWLIESMSKHIYADFKEEAAASFKAEFNRNLAKKYGSKITPEAFDKISESATKGFEQGLDASDLRKFIETGVKEGFARYKSSFKVRHGAFSMARRESDTDVRNEQVLAQARKVVPPASPYEAGIPGAKTEIRQFKRGRLVVEKRAGVEPGKEIDVPVWKA